MGVLNGSWDVLGSELKKARGKFTKKRNGKQIGSGFRMQIIANNPAHKAASERGAHAQGARKPWALKSPDVLDYDGSAFFSSFHMEAHEMFSKCGL